MRRTCMLHLGGRWWVFLLTPINLLAAQSEIPAVERIPDRQSVRRSELMSQPGKQRGDFLRQFTLASFGFSSTATGSEKPTRLSGTAENAPEGLECQRCVFRPVMERSRYTIPAFGGQTVWKPGARFEMATGMGGVNAWKPDNTLIEPNRTTAHNDAWLGEAWLTGKFAVDAKKRLWLGGAARAIQQFAPIPKKSSSFSGTATFHFGR